VARLLVIVGILVAGLGLALMAGFPFGRLPGDIVYRKGNTTLYIPIATSILVSVTLSGIMMLIRR
jgi:hypothetical protein